MPAVHFTLSRCRSGKTFICWLLTQYALYNGQVLKIYDLDPNFAISKFKALQARQLNLQVKNDDGSIGYDFSQVVTIMKETYSDVIFDAPAELFSLILNTFRKNDGELVKFLNKLDIKIVFHLPVSGGEYNKNEGIKCVNEVLTTITGVDCIVWLNHYPEPIFEENMTQNRLMNYFADKPSLKYIVDLPLLTSGENLTKDNDNLLLKQILSEKRIFGEILDPIHFKYAQEPSLNGVPVFIMTDYQIAFLRDESDKAIQNVAEIAS